MVDGHAAVNCHLAHRVANRMRQAHVVATRDTADYAKAWVGLVNPWGGGVRIGSTHWGFGLARWFQKPVDGLTRPRFERYGFDYIVNDDLPVFMEHEFDSKSP